MPSLNQSLFVLTAGLVLASPAIAKEAEKPDHLPNMHRHFTVWVGTLFTTINSEVKINGSTLPGGGLDGENLLGLSPTETVVWGGARWRFHKRNSLEFEYTELNRSHTGATMSDPVMIGDNIVQIGGRIDTAFDISLGSLRCRW
jgi:hypothetical protein